MEDCVNKAIHFYIGNDNVYKRFLGNALSLSSSDKMRLLSGTLDPLGVKPDDQCLFEILLSKLRDSGPLTASLIETDPAFLEKFWKTKLSLHRLSKQKPDDVLQLLQKEGCVFGSKESRDMFFRLLKLPSVTEPKPGYLWQRLVKVYEETKDYVQRIKLDVRMLILCHFDIVAKAISIVINAAMLDKVRQELDKSQGIVETQLRLLNDIVVPNVDSITSADIVKLEHNMTVLFNIDMALSTEIGRLTQLSQILEEKRTELLIDTLADVVMTAFSKIWLFFGLADAGLLVATQLYLSQTRSLNEEAKNGVENCNKKILALFNIIESII